MKEDCTLDFLANAIRCEVNSMTHKVLKDKQNTPKETSKKVLFLEKLMLIPRPKEMELAEIENINIIDYLETWDKEIWHIYQNAKRGE